MRIQHLAAIIGWRPGMYQSPLSKNASNPCHHKNTDGTQRCMECGATSLSFESSAKHYVDENHEKLVDYILTGRYQLVRMSGVRIMKHHWRHVEVIDTSKTPIKKLYEASQQFGAEHAAAITGTELLNPEDQCRDWLKANGYKQIEHSDFWEKA